MGRALLGALTLANWRQVPVPASTYILRNRERREWREGGGGKFRGSKPGALLRRIPAGRGGILRGSMVDDVLERHLSGFGQDEGDRQTHQCR